MNTNQNLSLINTAYKRGEKIKIMVIGVGSVGSYFIDYLLSLNNEQIEIIAVGRDKNKITKDINIIKTAATIRGVCKSKIIIDTLDLNNENSITECLQRHWPHIILNSSRVYSGKKYGSVSWDKIRAYGIWAPLSVKFIYNVMKAYDKVNSSAIVINTSYSDATNNWIKSSGVSYPDFGSGNLNHLIPRIKFAVAKILNIEDFWNINITLATSHFHDVVISKEGHDENCPPLLHLEYKGKTLKIDHDLIYNNCAIVMPIDQKRNMMNASSNFEIVKAILNSIKNNYSIKIHSPGVQGMIGGYPCIISSFNNQTKCEIDTSVFTIKEMNDINLKSIYLDGIKGIRDGYIFYTAELINKIKEKFNIDIPETIHINEADYLIELLNRIL